MSSYALKTKDLNDPIALGAELIRIPSVTPIDDGAQDMLIAALSQLGFDHYDVTRRDDIETIRNTFFRLGDEKNDKGPHFCFAGHTDVVPPGDIDKWSHDPFGAVIDDGFMYGRGTADMKCNITCFVAAISRYIKDHGKPKGSISLVITGDEEARAINGTQAMLPWMKDNGHIPDICLVGEPSNPENIGEVMKIGRRGSLNCLLTLKGKQGHVAYPHKADNPIPRLTQLLANLTSTALDEGSDFFPPSTLQISTIDVGNPAHNVIPAQAKATFNIRFNDLWDEDNLKAHLLGIFKDYLRDDDEIVWHCHGNSFLTKPGKYTDILKNAIQDITGKMPEMKTDGGTSDARFIYKYCPVMEFGLVNKTIHQIDERVSVNDLETLTEIYKRVLERFFETT